MGRREELLQSITEALQEMNVEGLEFIDRCFIQPLKGSERYTVKKNQTRKKGSAAQV